MAGTAVDRFVLDTKMGYCIVALRQANEQCSHINQWLNNNPVPAPPDVDPLTAAPFNYTADEAYAIRLIFQNFATNYANQASNFVTASKLTGVE